MDATAKKILIWGGAGAAVLYFILRKHPTPLPDYGDVINYGATDANLNTDINGGAGAAILSGQTF